MEISVPTLLLVVVIVAFTTSLLLAISWLQNPAARCLFLWSTSNLSATVAVLLLLARNAIPDFLSLHGGYIVLLTSAAIAWAGVREFHNKRIPVALVAIAPAAWTVFCLIPVIEQSMFARTVLSSSFIAFYALASAYEFWEGRAEKLVSRYPALIFSAIHGLFFLARIPAALIFGVPNARDILSSPMILYISFEALIYVVAISFMRIALVKERAELENREAATTDLLTGIANRRAFFERGLTLMDKSRSDGSYCTLLLMDLDHFKTINDRWGHAVGDMVLQEFVRRTRAALGPNTLLARFGGEEFAALIYGVPPDDVFALAENVRSSIAASPFTIDYVQASVTVSMGMAYATGGDYRLDNLLVLGDQALYCAKRNGRNRIECAMIEEMAQECAAA